MKKFNLFLILISLAISFGWTYQVQFGERPEIDLTRVPDDAFYQNHLRIKFVEELTTHLDNHHVRYDEHGYVRFDIPEIDNLNRLYSVKEAVLLFDSPALDNQYKERHRAWGFHLWYELRFTEDQDIRAVVTEYEKLAAVEIAEPEYKKIRYFDPDRDDPSYRWTPNDPYFSTQWHYNNTGQQSGTPGADIRLVNAWNIEKGNSSVIVAIIDGGIQINHPDIAANMWSGIGYNFVDNNTTITADNHGTHVAGTVAAVNNNGVGVAGVAGGSGSGNGVRLMTCQVFRGNSQGGFSTAPIWAADNGAAISQNSWGYNNPGVYNTSDLNAIDYFNMNGGGTAMTGGITIFAAGNDNSSANWYPGYYSGAFAVAATTNTDTRAYYSNYGTWIDVSAPGGETISVTARGVRSTIAGSNYAYYQGTSMACPHVSGVAALIVSLAYGQLTRFQVRDILRDSTDNHYGVNPGYTGQLGTGRINAHAALILTQDYLGVLNPQSFTATPVGLNQINLTWTRNINSNSVMVVWSPTGTLGTPVDGTVYTAGQTIPGGGTVLYRGSNTSYNHTGLEQGTTYYYKAFSYNATNEYSSGRTAQATTDYDAFMLPLSENFNASTSLPDFWEIVDHQGNGQVWQFGTFSPGGLSGTTGNYAYLNSDTYGSGNSQNADLITPTLDLTYNYDVTLSFTHYYRHFSGSSATLSYSINDGATWTTIQTWTANTTNPSTFNQIIPAVAGHSQVKFKWNYSGTWGYYWSVDNVLITGQGAPPGPGIIEGTVTLTGGSGNVMNVLITAGDETTNPAINGSYTLTLPEGTYDVTASLAGYQSQTIPDVLVIGDQTTSGINFNLQYMAPMIEVTPDLFDVELNPNELITSPMTISNDGNETLEFSISILEDPRSLINNYENMEIFETQTSNREPIEIYYDNGVIVNGVGSGSALNIIAAVRFTADELAAYYGEYEISGVKYHIRQEYFSNVTIKIWEGGSLGNPGSEIYSQDVTGSVVVGDWSIHNLLSSIPLITGNEYWIGYSINITSQYPASRDTSPMVADKGGWIYYNSAWSQLTAFGINNNWCIRGFLSDFTGGWLSISPRMGNVAPGSSSNINVTFDSTDLTPGSLHTADIVISNNAGDDVIVPASLSVSGTILPSPDNLTAIAGDSVVDLSWNAPDSRSLIGYNIYRNELQINSETVIETAYSDYELVNGTTYSYYVTAIYTAGESAPSNTVEATPLAPPSNLEGMPGDGFVNLYWVAPAIRSLIEYNIYRDGLLIDTIIAPQTEYTDSGLGNGISYSYYITAVYEVHGESTPSNTVVVTTLLGTVATPTFNPPEQGEPFGETFTLNISTTTPAATIWYKTAEDDDWTAGNSLEIDQSITVWAMATKSNWADSEVISALYELQVATPALNPEPQIEPFEEPIYISLSTTTPDATILYRTLEETGVRNNEWVEYVEPFYLFYNSFIELEVKGVKTGWLDSEITYASYAVNPGQAGIMISNLEQVYSGDPLGVTVSTTPSGLDYIVTYNGSELLPLDAGSYNVVVTIVDEYYAGSETATLQILPYPVTLLADPKSKIYGEADPLFTYQVTPALISGDEFTGSLIRMPGEDVGEYEILQGTLSAGENYAITYESAYLLIIPATAMIEISNLDQIYGSVEDVTVVTSPVGLNYSITYDGSSELPVNSGTYIVEVIIDELNYVGLETATLEISPLAITVTADPQTKIYGAEDPPLTYSVTPGLIAGDSFTGAITRMPGDDVGEYEILQGTLTAGDNYEITYIADYLTILPATVTIEISNLVQTYGSVEEVTVVTTPEGLEQNLLYDGVPELPFNAGSYIVEVNIMELNYIGSEAATLQILPLEITVSVDPQNKVYGSADPVFTYTLAPSLIAGDEFTGELTRLEGEDVGDYEILQGTLTAGSNYIITYESAFLTILPATTTIEISNLDQVYGSVENVSVTTTPEGLAYNITYDGLPELPTNVGTYNVEVTIIEWNYIGSDTATLEISPLAITVTADLQTKVYGEEDPQLTYSVAPGLIAGDSFTGAITRMPGDDVGEYEILQGTLTAGMNYTITFLSDYLAILPATTLIEISNLDQVYGSVENVSVTTTPEGLAYNITYDGLPELPINVGTYNVEVTIIEWNYIGSETATLEISPLAITVTADLQTKVYGEEDPPLTYSVTPGLIAGDSFTGALTREPGEDIGEYPILHGTLNAGENYAIDFIPNVLVIIPLVDLSTPVVNITIVNDMVILNWDLINGANSYKILASEDPYIPEEEWTHVITVNINEYSEPLTSQKFYKVVASTEFLQE